MKGCVCVCGGGEGEGERKDEWEGEKGWKKNSEQQFRVRYEIAGEDGEWRITGGGEEQKKNTWPFEERHGYEKLFERPFRWSILHFSGSNLQQVMNLFSSRSTVHAFFVTTFFRAINHVIIMKFLSLKSSGEGKSGKKKLYFDPVIRGMSRTKPPRVRGRSFHYNH